jgi:ubiquinone/menaquinone biosynthesis C-methylase UbiE
MSPTGWVAVPATKGRTDYGIDAPNVVAANLAVGLLAIFVAILLLALFPHRPYWSIPVPVGIVCVGFSLSFILSSKVGKLWVRDWIIEAIDWRGDEHVLDVGCGRGLLLIAAAKRLTTGTAVGVDIWRPTDQTGSSPRVTLSNARAEGVQDRVAVRNADARDLPFGSSSFDVVLSGLVLHNIRREEKPRAIQEMVRVLKPGGRLAIFDTWSNKRYAKELTALGMQQVDFSVPLPLFLSPTRIVTATKPMGWQGGRSRAGPRSPEPRRLRKALMMSPGESSR